MDKFLKVFKINVWVIISIFLLAFSLGCQDEFDEIENEELNNLKVATIPKGNLPGGAEYEILLPPNWNVLPQKYLLIYAHGYRDFDAPVELPADEVEDGVTIQQFLLAANWAYASTSYRENGLVVLKAIDDILELREKIDDYFDNPDIEKPDYIFLAGPSEGALISILTIEEHSELFDGCLATCGPIGNLYKQMQYFGDALLLFKYFFFESFEFPPSTGNMVNLGTPNGIPLETIAAWNLDISHPLGLTYLQAKIAAALQDDFDNNQGKNILQFLKCSKIPVDKNDPEAIGQAIIEVLRYGIKATNDVCIRLNGSPYNNLRKWYFGSFNDLKLNKKIERIKGDNWFAARNKVYQNYHPTGNLEIPLVTMHTTGDHIALYWHEMLFSYKVMMNRDFRFYMHLPVKRYGHCTFTPEEVTLALTLMVKKATMQSYFLHDFAFFSNDN